MKKIKTRIDFFKEHPGMIIAELGVYRGEFSRELLACNPKLLYLVDIWTGVTTSADVNGTNNSIEWDIFKTYVKLCHEFANDPVIMIRGASSNFLNSIADDSLDCVYIDSDHSYFTVHQELELSIAKVKPGGWITGHDYVHWTPGVIRAVDEFLIKTGYKLEYMSEDGCPSFYIINDK
jgi:hypothetical protein